MDLFSKPNFLDSSNKKFNHTNVKKSLCLRFVCYPQKNKWQNIINLSEKAV